MIDNELLVEIEFPPVLRQEETVSKAMSLLQEDNDIIIIIDNSQKYIGLIRTRDIVGKGIKPESLCKSYLERIPPIVEKSSYNPITIGEMMVNSGSRFIPIINKYNVVKGALKDQKVLAALQYLIKGQTQLKNSDAVNWDLVSLNENDSVGNALVNFRTHGFSRIPIFGSNSEFLGIIRDRSFLQTQREKRTTVGDIAGDRDKDWHLVPVKDFLLPMSVLAGNMQLLEVIDRFINQEESSVFIQVDNKEIGIITPLDIIRLAITESYPEEFDIVVMQAPDDSIKSHSKRKGNSIIKRHKSWLGAQCELIVRFKRNVSQSKRGQFSITVTIRLNTGSGKKYNSEATGFGAEKAVNQALDNLSRIISDDKRKVLTKRDKSRSYRQSFEFEN
ncbi:MAG: CBS domain-containing protein [Candidatus Hodarchaeales archaeon]